MNEMMNKCRFPAQLKVAQVAEGEIKPKKMSARLTQGRMDEVQLQAAQA